VTASNLEDIGEAFFEIERHEGLYDWKVGGISVWVLLRSRLFRTITQNANLYDWSTAKKFELPSDAVPYAGANAAGLLWSAAHGRAKAAVTAGEPDFRNLKGFKAIVVPFATRSAASPLEEKFSQPVIDALGADALVFGVGMWDKLSNRARLEDLNSLFIKKYGTLASISVRLLLRGRDYKKYQRVVEFIEREVGVSMAPYDVFPRWLLRSFIAERRGYRKLLAATSAKTVYMVNAARMSFQAAAQSLGMKIVEIQSGVFSKYSLQFSWPGSPKVDYLPNEILTWGEYFTDGIEHAAGQNIRVIGSTAEFDAVREANLKRDSNQVVFLTQPLVGNDILRAAIEFARAKPKLKVIVKMHPRNDLEDFKKVIEAAGGAPQNMTLMQSERSSLEVIAESEVAVGAFSTALIEAAGLGTKVAILRLPGWQHLAPMVDAGYASAFDSADELAANYDNLRVAGDKYFFYGQRADIASLVRLG
jgi:hypothetical protein